MRRAAIALLLVGCGGTEPLINQPPVAIVPNDIVTRPGVLVRLDGGASKDPDGTIVSYRWSFGDGQEGEGALVEHTWTTGGVFVVQLVVTDDLGAEDVAAMRVTTSTVDDSNRMPIAVISGAARGDANVALSFDGAASSDDDGAIVAYRWRFGDGASEEGASVTHAWATDGSYTVSLEVEDDDGALGRTSRSVVIGSSTNNRAPIAEAGPDLAGEVGEPVTFNGSASIDPDGDPLVAYAWDFGDGATATTPQTTHTFASAGTYVVTLTVTDDGGLTGEDTTTVTIAPPPSYDGQWIFNPTMAAQNCPRTQVAFPTPRLEISGTTTATTTAIVTGQNRTMSGAVDRSAAPPRMMLAWAGAETHASCGTASVRHSFSADLTTPTTMAGTVTILYMWTDAFCNCSRAFAFTGARQ